jgi:hypothetical protein
MRNVITSFIVAVVAAAAPLLAQTPPKAAQIVVNNAPAGINIDIFLDAGKVQTVPVNQQGTAAFNLDFLSMGKPQGQLYVEVCKDGQRIRVVSDGATVPEDEGCNRKPAGVVFTFTCTHKITLNFAAAKASFAGCGSMLTNKWTWVAVGAGATGVAVGASGGDSYSSSSSSAAPVVQQQVAAQPTIQVPTVTAPTVNSSNPAPPPVTAPTFDVAIVLTHNHPGGSTSTLCGRISTTPAQPGATYTIRPAGPGLVNPSTIGGILNSAGMAVFNWTINLFGSYSAEASITANGATKTAAATHEVGSPQDQCPQ